MSYFERAGFEPRPNLLTDAVKRLSGFLTFGPALREIAAASVFGKRLPKRFEYY